MESRRTPNGDQHGVLSSTFRNLPPGALQGRVWGGFWMDLGRILGGFWKDFSMVFRFCLKTANFVKYSVLPRKNHYISYVALLKNNKKSTKKRRKSDANLGQENKRKKNAQKSDLGGFWLPFGRGLGGSGASLGHSWALLGCFLGVQKPTSSKHWSRMGSKRPSGSILEPFWEGLGRFWEGF